MYRNIELAKELSQIPLIAEIDSLKKQVDVLRPLSREIEQRILQKFRLEWNYHSNAIEGNPYTYGETVAFLLEGITAKGKTLKDHLDIKGHDESITYLLKVVKEKEYQLTEAEIRNLHKLLLKEPYLSDAITPDGTPTKKEIKLGEYKQTPNHVKTPTGAIHYYASPEETPIKMGELMTWYNAIKNNKEVHPLVIAVLFHHQFAAIHPFDDGNGRMARLLMNLVLLQNGFPPIVVKQEDKMNYYQVLRQADGREYLPIIEYMGELLTDSLKIYLTGAKGESIEDREDIKKQIALLKQSLESKISENQKGLNEKVLLRKKTLNECVLPLFRSLHKNINDFKLLFTSIDFSFAFDFFAASTVSYKQFADFEQALFSLDNKKILNLDHISLLVNLNNLKINNQEINHHEYIQVNALIKPDSIIISAKNEFPKKIVEVGNRLTDNEVKDFVQNVINSLMQEINRLF
jgi:Fic family protein